MKMYVARHGDSVPNGADDARPLSETGKEDIKRLAQVLASLPIQVARIIHSPKYRTQQTAEILAGAGGLSFTSMLEMSGELDPAAPIFPIVNDVVSRGEDSLLVGHLPFVSRLVSLLTSGTEENHVSLFQPGCIVCLEQIEKNRWGIEWMLSPALVEVVTAD